MSLRDKLKDSVITPDRSIIDGVDQKTFPFANNKFFGNNAEELALTEFNRCLELFKSRANPKFVTNLNMGTSGYINAMAHTLNIKSDIQLIESFHKVKIEEIAEKVIREIYDIPENVDMQGFLEPPSDEEFDPSGVQKEDKEEPWDEGDQMSDERKKEIQDLAQKRVILNSLSHGSSIHIWKSAYFMVKSELDKLDSSLIDMYNEYTSFVSILLWMFPTEMMKNSIETGSGRIDQGYSKVSWSDEVEEEEEEEFDGEMEDEYQKYLESLDEESEEVLPIGIGVGINFPVLLHELNKAAFEILTMNSIPEPGEYTDDEIKYYYSIADDYRDEPWHYYLGPALWTNLLEVINESDQEVANTIMLFSDINYDSLSKFCILVMEDKEKAVGRLNLMAEMFDD